MNSSPQYLDSSQDKRLRRWEFWNRIYFTVSFGIILVLLVFSSALGLSSGQEWGSLGLILAVAVIPIIVMQWRLKCPACEHSIGWQAKMSAPDQCRHCGTFLRARDRHK